MNDPAAIKSALAEEARVCGFNAFGVVKPGAAPELKTRLEDYIAGGAHGDMTWLAASADRRDFAAHHVAGSPLDHHAGAELRAR